jgi:hypothetical protein
MKRSVAFLLVVALACGGVACKKRSGVLDAGPSPDLAPPWQALLTLLPAELTWVAFAGDAAALLKGGRAFLNKLRGSTVGITLEEMVRLWQHKAGLREIDVFDPAAWQARGIDLGRGAALLGDKENKVHLAFGVSDPVKAEALLRGILQQVDGAVSFKKSGEATVAVNKAGKPTAVYAFHQGYALLASPLQSEAEGLALMARFRRPDAARFTQSPAYPTLARRTVLGRGLSLLVVPGFVESLPSELARMFAGFRGISLRFEPSAAGASFFAHLGTRPESAQKAQRLFPGGAASAGLARHLTADTVVAASGRLDLGAAIDLLAEGVPEGQKVVKTLFERLKKKYDLDVEGELFRNLTGDLALGIHKVDAAALPLLFGGAGLAEALASEPFHVTLLLRVRDPVVAAKLLRKVAVIADVPTEKIGGVEVFPLPLGRLLAPGASSKGLALRLALVGTTLLCTTGSGRMAKALAGLEAPGGGGFVRQVSDPQTLALLERGSPPVVYVVGPSLTENLREIESAFLRQKKLLLSSVVQKAIETIERFADLSLGGEALPDGASLWLHLRLR